MYIPPKFASDIEGKHTNLAPVIIIGNWIYLGSYQSRGYLADDALYLGLNNLSLSVIKEVNSSTENETVYRRENFKPILLNIPSIKESIDLINRKYNISSINIDIANVKYNNKRFSDSISYKSLINTEVRIFWVSPNVEKISFYDLENIVQDSWNVSDEDAFQVYYGTIRRYEHDDEKVKLVVEDRSQSKLHIDFPKLNIGAGVNISERYKNRYVPMVFGRVDRSPVTPHYSISEEITTSEGTSEDIIEFRLKADDKEIFEFVEEEVDIGNTAHIISALYFYDNGVYHNVHRANAELGDGVSEDEDGNVVPNGDINFRYGETDIVMDTDYTEYGTEGEQLENDFSEGHLRVHAIRDIIRHTPYTGSTNPASYSYEDEIKFFEDQYYMARMEGSILVRIINSDLSGQTSTAAGGTYGGYKLYLADITVPSNLAVDKNTGNVLKPTTTLLADIELLNWSDSDQIDPFAWETDWLPNNPNEAPDSDIPVKRTHFAVLKDEQGSIGWMNNEQHLGMTEGQNPYPYDYDNMTGDDWGASHLGRLVRDIHWFNTLTSHDHIKIGIPLHWYEAEDNHNLNDDTVVQWGFRMQINKAFIVQTYKVMGIVDKEYYANVAGRNVFSEDSNANRMDRCILEIIEELGYDLGDSLTELATTASDYNLNTGSGDDDHYSFTVHEKINSKKLLENFASVTPLIPRFDNMGKFSLAVIRNGFDIGSGTVNDLETLQQIKQNDVIDYSFARTKIEDIKTTVTVKYKFDYARKELTRSTKPIYASYHSDLIAEEPADFASQFYSETQTYAYRPDYYGLDVDHTESELLVDDYRGEFIRTEHTANKLRDWLLYWHCNQHLILKIKLPLTYLSLEIGDAITIDSILGDVKPYGIDYHYKDANNYAFYSHPDGEGVAIGHEVNGQQVYPGFIITKTNKTLDYVDIECVQIHNLTEEILRTDQVIGCMDANAWNYNAEANIQPNQVNCYYPNNFLVTGSNACLWEVFLGGTQAGSGAYVDYAENYVGDNVSINDENVFLYVNYDPENEFIPENITLQAAKLYWEQQGFPEPGSDNAPKLYSWQQCVWHDIKYHRLQSIQIQGMDAEGNWNTIGSYAGVYSDAFQNDIVIEMDYNFREHYTENYQIRAIFHFQLQDAYYPPTFAEDAIFQYDYYKETIVDGDVWQNSYGDFIDTNINIGDENEEYPHIYNGQSIILENEIDTESWNDENYTFAIKLANILYISDFQPAPESEEYSQPSDIGEYAEQNYITNIIFQGSYIPPDVEAGSGDVNGDGVLNIIDLLMTVQYMLGAYTIDDPSIADMNADGIVDILDLVTMIHAILDADNSLRKD